MASIRPFRFGHVVFITSIGLGLCSASCGSENGSSGRTEDTSAAGSSTHEGGGGQESRSSEVGLTAAGGAGDPSRSANSSSGGNTLASSGSVGGAGSAGVGGAGSAGVGGAGSAGVGGAGSAGVNSVGSYTEFCVSVASTVCSAISNCCGMTRSECEAGYERLCLRQWDMAAGAVYMPDRAEACLPLLAGMFDGCEYQPAESEVYRSAQVACERVVIGNVPEGGICANDRYCASDATSASVCTADGSGISRCKAVPWIAVDAPCGDPAAQRCVSGSFCDNAKRSCAPQRKTGEACDSPMQCLSYHCDSGICKPATTAGICSNIST